MTSSFDNLVLGIRRGDASAAVRLVREYEPEIRRAIRIQLYDSPLQRQFDSADICQSVLAHFFARASAGDFELDRPEKVLGLLVTMARNNLTDKARAHHRARRHPGGYQYEGDKVLRELVDDAASPGQALQCAELLDKIKQHLNDEEAVLLDYRAQGLQWPEIAARVNGRPDALRKKFRRALDRVVQEPDIREWLG